MKTEVKVVCPSCKSSIDVNDLLVDQFQDSIRNDLQAELREREENLQEQRNEVKLLSKKLAEERDEIDEIIQERVKAQIRSKEEILRNNIRLEIQEEKEAELLSLEEELKKKSVQLVDFNKTKTRMQRLTQEFEERESQIHLDKERELAERLAEAKISIKDQMQMESFLKISEKQAVIDSLKKKLQEATRKAEQGSIQNQGEAQELVLEEILQQANPTDIIEEVKKGIRGADCIQTVQTQTGIKCGTIVYESKRTKVWSDSFIQKLKLDNLSTKADLMVIITATMPREATGKFALIDGVWITTLDNARDLSLMLRFGILKTFSVMISQNGKKDKMSLLYDYLTSENFRETFEHILKGFANLQESHFEEQRKLQLLWKKRAKNLEEILSSTIEFYGNIKSIGGESISDIKMLEIINQAS